MERKEIYLNWYLQDFAPPFCLLDSFMFSVYFLIPPSVPYCLQNSLRYVWVALIYIAVGKSKDWLNWVQLRCGSLEGVKEREPGREREKTWLSLRGRAPRGGGAGLRVAAPPSLCQQVESVIAVPGEGVRARTPITNHRLPAVGSWSRIVSGKEAWVLPSSELPKSIHDSEIPPSPSGIFCFWYWIVVFTTSLSFKSWSFNFLYRSWGKGLLLDFGDDFGSSLSISRVLEDSSSRPGISFCLWPAWIAFSGFGISRHLPVVCALVWLQSEKVEEDWAALG